MDRLTAACAPVNPAIIIVFQQLLLLDKGTNQSGAIRESSMSADDVVTEPEDLREEDAYAIDRKAIAAILYAVDTDNQAQLTELLEPLHPADIGHRSVDR